MWHYKRPSLDKASEVIFGPGSTWIPIIPSTPTPGASHRAQVLDQRLYGVIGFQRHVIAALGDNRIVGTVDTSGGGHWGVKMLGGWSFSTSTEEPAVPAGSTSAPVRARDYYAYKVAHQTGAPNFELYWPLTRRDAAIVAALAWVTAQH